MDMMIRKARPIGHEGEKWDAYFYPTGWGHLSFGVSLCLGLPNIEIHVPFGFFRIGRSQLNPLWGAK